MLDKIELRAMRNTDTFQIEFWKWGFYKCKSMQNLTISVSEKFPKNNGSGWDISRTIFMKTNFKNPN